MSLKRKAAEVVANGAKKPKANATLTSFFGQPKIVSSSSDGPGSKFDKEAWVKSLATEQKALLQLEIKTLDDSWLELLKDEIVKPEFLALKKFIAKEISSGKKVFPPLNDIYSWSRHTPFSKVKVVILGQDPYHNVNQAHGLCFSVRPPTKAPPSLVNIFKELKTEYPDFKAPLNNGGLLTPWADRGVLLINTCLTVRAHEANSHSKQGWERFTQKIIDLVNQKKNGVVFMAWGKPAQQRVTAVTSKHLVLKSVHPSPLSASNGWFGCGHFKEANTWLKQRHGDDAEIDWSLNVDPEKTGV